jgi:hypothetical protein
MLGMTLSDFSGADPPKNQDGPESGRSPFTKTLHVSYVIVSYITT